MVCHNFSIMSVIYIGDDVSVMFSASSPMRVGEGDGFVEVCLTVNLNGSLECDLEYLLNFSVEDDGDARK